MSHFCVAAVAACHVHTHTAVAATSVAPRSRHSDRTACNTQAPVLLPTPRRQSAPTSRPVASSRAAASRLSGSAASSPAGRSATSARRRRLPPTATATATSLAVGTDKGPSSLAAAASRSAGRHKSRPLLHPGSQSQPASTSGSKMWTARQKKTASLQRRSTTPPHPKEEGGGPGTPGLTARQGETGRQPPEPRSKPGYTASMVMGQLTAAALLKPPGRRQKTATFLIQLQTRASRLMPLTRLCILRGSRCHAGCTSWALMQCPRRSEQQGLRLQLWLRNDCVPLNLRSHLHWWSTVVLRPAAVAT